MADLYTEIATLAGGLAHEIKNPLSTIRLNMELLAEDFADSKTPQDRRALAKIARVQNECQRLEGLLNSFLNFAQAAQLNLEPADLNAAIDRVLDFFRPKADESRIEIVRYLDPDLPSVLLDRETFQAALLNLVLNAQQAMTDGGQLVLRTRPTPNGRGTGPDRHGLRHGRRDRGRNLRHVLFDQARRLGPRPADRPQDHRRPRRPDHRRERDRQGDEIHDRAPRPAATGGGADDGEI